MRNTKARTDLGDESSNSLLQGPGDGTHEEQMKTRSILHHQTFGRHLQESATINYNGATLVTFLTVEFITSHLGGSKVKRLEIGKLLLGLSVQLYWLVYSPDLLNIRIFSNSRTNFGELSLKM